MRDYAVIIRDARGHERGAVRELTLRAYAEYARVMEPSAWAGLERSVRDALDSDVEAQRIVVEIEGALVGSVMLFPPAVDTFGGGAQAAGWPELRLLAVAPEARRLGIGRVLVEECIRRAREMGAAELGLHTSKSMRSAIRMYELMGFVRAPEYDFQPEGAELVQAYRLDLGRSRLGKPVKGG